MESIIYLYGVEKETNNASPSGFCQKVETYLRLRKLRYEHVATYPPMAPKGKLPYIKYENDIIADSSFIINYIESKIGPLVKEESALDKANIRAWKSLIEETFYPCVVYDRWCPDENYLITYQEAFGKISWPLRDCLSMYFRSLITKTLYTNGIARHSKVDVESINAECVQSVAVLLGEKKYFSGQESPNQLDVLMYSFLVNALGYEGNVFTKSLIVANHGLLRYVEHMTKGLFPEYERVLQQIATALLLVVEERKQE